MDVRGAFNHRARVRIFVDDPVQSHLSKKYMTSNMTLAALRPLHRARVIPSCVPRPSRRSAQTAAAE